MESKYAQDKILQCELWLYDINCATQIKWYRKKKEFIYGQLINMTIAKRFWLAL